MAQLSEDEAATLAALQAKAAAPDDDPADAGENVAVVTEAAGETAAEVGAAVADAVAEVASTVAAVTASVVNDAREDEAERLERERNEARVDAAVAEMTAEAREREAAEVIAAVVEPIAEAEASTVVNVEDGGEAVVVDAGPGDDVVDATPSAQHPYFGKRVRLPWQH